MDNQDKTEFAETVTAVAEFYGKEVSRAGLQMWWAALEDYGIGQLRQAFNAHAKDTKRGSFMPTPADIIRQIDGETPTPDQIIGAAMKPRTALAVLCRAEIGTWNLDNWTAYQLKPMAEHCISMLPEWRQRIARGELTKHERTLLAKYDIDPQSTRLTGPRLAIGHSETGE